MAKILILGGSGMLGTDLVSELRSRDHEVLAPDLEELDVTDPSEVARIGAGELGSFEWIMNCAAYTAVDKAESEVREATELNSFAPGYLALAAQANGARFLHLSTDFVFDGAATTPYAEEAPTRPLSSYGRTKRDGEEAALSNNTQTVIVRTSWLYGPNGPSFPRTMVRAWLARKPLRVVADQIGCPTYTSYLARVLAEMTSLSPHPGIYHAVGPETMSWHGFATRAIEAWQRKAGLPIGVEIEAIRTEDWPTPAIRPRYSVLGMEKLARLGIGPMAPVDEALDDFCHRLRLENT